jgi:hypothetical protein
MDWSIKSIDPGVLAALVDRRALSEIIPRFAGILEDRP